MATPTSYLQTLAPAEATAFITSLEKVQIHLQQELEWMNQQVQQKTVQLQGIETLLTEALALGLLETDADLTATPVSSEAQATTAVASEPAAASPPAPPPDDAEAIATSEEASTSTPAQAAADSAIDAPAPTAAKPPTKAKSRQLSSSKAAARRKSGGKAQSRSKASKTSPQSKARALLRPKFADVSLADAVTQVLTQTAEPLHVDQIVSELYEGVAGEDLKRVKASLANVFSKGKRAGKWQNVGNGLYQIK